MATIKDNIQNHFTAYHKISYEQKKANDYKWIEENARFISDAAVGNSLNVYSRNNELQKYYSIANGEGEEDFRQVQAAKNKVLSELGLESSGRVKYYDITRKVLTRMWGENQKRKLKGIAQDRSRYNMTFKKLKEQQLLQELIQTSFIDRLVQQEEQALMMQYGLNDIYSLNPDEQEQFKLEVDQKVAFKTPNDVKRYMRKEYKSPTEKDLQVLIDWGIQEFNLKVLLDEAFKDLTIAGTQVIFQEVRNKFPHIEIVNPKGFQFYNPTSSRNIEDSEWFVYEKHISYPDFVNNFIQTPEELDKLVDIVNNYGTLDPKRQFNGETHPNIIKAMQNSAIAPSAVIDTATRETFYDLANVNNPKSSKFYEAMGLVFGGSSYQHNSVVDTVCIKHVVFSSLDKLYYVERVDPENPNRLKGYWVGENYEPNNKIDFSVTERWVKSLYEDSIAGHGGGAMHLRKRRVPYQNRSINNPFKLYSPYIGTVYSKLHGNTKPISPLSLSKSYAYEYNVVKDKIRELDEVNVGKVLAMSLAGIPDQYTAAKYALLMKHTKLALIDTSNPEFNPGIDGNLTKGVDLSQEYDIIKSLERLDRIERECMEAMSYSPAQMGLAPASSTATVNQQNIIQSSYATEDIYSLHRDFEQRVLNSFGNTLRNCLRENDFLRESLLDDYSQQGLLLDEQVLSSADLFILIANDIDEMESIKFSKSYIQPMLQNQLIGFADSIKLQNANDPVTMLNIAEEAEERRNKAMQEQAAEDKRRFDEDLKIREQERKDKLDLEYKKLEIQVLGYQLDSLKFQKAADADENKIPDSVQTAEIKSKTDLEIAKLQGELQRQKQNLEAMLAQQELVIKNKEADAKLIAAKKPSSSR